MEAWQTNVTAWLQSLSGWLQSVTGMTTKDIALFAGGALMMVAVLWLGLYAGKPRYREAARFGWSLLFVACGVIVWGIVNHNQQ